MTLEDKFKKQLGDLSFAVTVLQHQLEEAQAQLESMKNADNSATES